MPARLIFVPLGGGLGDETALDLARALAAGLDASVEAVFVGPDDVAALMFAGDGFTGFGPAAIGELQAARRAGQKAAEDLCAARPGISFRVHQGGRAQATAASRLAAVAVVGDAAAKGAGPLADVFRALLIEDGSPVLVARAAPAPKRIALAWDGSKEAARALKSAAPLLAGAEVVVLQSARGVDAKAAPVAEPGLAADFIRRQGASAEIVILAAEGGVAGALIEGCEAAGADLLIAGAYGQARLREAILGGVTRDLLDRAGPSLWLAH